MTLSQLTSLEDRLREAKGRDREIDGRLWCTCSGYDFVMWDGAGCVYREKPAGDIRHWRHEWVPEYTSSIDTALGLVERCLPGARWRLIQRPDFSYEAAIVCPHPKSFLEFIDQAESAPIAILLALISALKEKEAGNV